MRRFKPWRLRRAYTEIKAENDRTFWSIHARLASVTGKESLRATVELFKRDHHEAYVAQKALFTRIAQMEGRI